MIRAEVRKTLGEQPRELRSYYEAYKKEFRGAAEYSNRPALIAAAQKADIVLVGDYHTFSQSQRSALRLLTDLWNLDDPTEPNKRGLALGLELVRTEDQKYLDQFLEDAISENELLKKIDYSKKWGFPWENFRPLVLFAKERGLPVLALNTGTSELTARDQHAAEVISQFALANPNRRLVVLYGDLHLASGHIPRKIKTELARAKSKRKILTVFQNSESLYWRLASQGREHTVDVLKLSSDRYCIISAAPWVKLQSYLQWAEASQLIDEGEGISFHELTTQNLKHLAETLQLPLNSVVDFSIHTVNDLAFLSNSELLRSLTKAELRTIKAQVLGNRTVLIPMRTKGTLSSPSIAIYLPSESVNAVGEAASTLLHASHSGSLDILVDPQRHFFQNLLRNMIAYFGSKTLNHKRKCDLEDDFRALANRALGKKPLLQERTTKKVAGLVLKHCESQRRYLREPNGRYVSRPLPISLAIGPNRGSIFLEATRNLGFIAGEKLYNSFASGKTKLEFIQKIYTTTLNGDRISQQNAKKLYLDLLRELQNAPVTHTSKEEVF